MANGKGRTYVLKDRHPYDGQEIEPVEWDAPLISVQQIIRDLRVVQNRYYRASDVYFEFGEDLDTGRELSHCGDGIGVAIDALKEKYNVKEE